MKKEGPNGNNSGKGSSAGNVDVVAKLWGFCHTLRHDGIDYGDYIEQITYLLFLKMADEKGVAIPKKCDWPTIRDLSGTELTEHYVDVLRTLGKTSGILGDIYSGALSRFTNPVNLKKLVTLIDEVQWTELGTDIKAAAYEGLLEKAAAEGKKGAGQYFTPRVLIQAIVRCMKPDPRVKADFTICDPAVGTGGFLVAAYEWLAHASKGALDRDVAKRVRTKTYFGEELVARPRRLALMNLYLHGIEPHIVFGDSIYEPASSDRFDVVLTNPPFGTKGANQAPERDDFTVSTSNKQLNFVQHILTILKKGGRAAVVLPDNCLFADQAGEVMKVLAEDCDLHTVLRLPRGTFTPYSQGVKANVIFFSKGYPTENVWIYDARTNVPGITKKDRPLTPEHFAEFEKCYGANPNGKAKRKPADSKDDRWRSFPISEVKERAFKLDGFKWLKEESLDDMDDLPPPEELATEAIGELQDALGELNQIVAMLEGNEKPATKSKRAT
jgi:type I restriction enzyme M protein